MKEKVEEEEEARPQHSKIITVTVHTNNAKQQKYSN